jgi:predicted O-methyltransferase YrrM
MLEEFIRRLLGDPEMLRMGHHQRREDLNLGLGWVYYALARLVRARHAVVIGSWRGYAPAIIGRALADNLEDGIVDFIDPSYADGFWTDKAKVEAHFAALGTPNVRHHRCTTREFAASGDFAALGEVDLLMVDGLHTAEQARADYLAFLGKLGRDALVLFHDSVRAKESPIYGRDNTYTHSVFVFMERLRETPGLETFTLPFADGVTLVRGRPETLTRILAPFEALSAPVLPRRS